MRMSRVNLYRDLQEADRPDPSRRLGVLDGHLSLNRATYMTEQAVIGPFMRTSLTHWKGENQNDGRKHGGHSKPGTLLTLGHYRSTNGFAWTNRTKDSVPELQYCFSSWRDSRWDLLQAFRLAPPWSSP